MTPEEEEQKRIEEQERIELLLSEDEIHPHEPGDEDRKKPTIEEMGAQVLMGELLRQRRLRQRDAANLLDRCFGNGRLVHRTNHAKRSIDPKVRQHLHDLAGPGLTYDKTRRVWRL